MFDAETDILIIRRKDSTTKHSEGEEEREQGIHPTLVTSEEY